MAWLIGMVSAVGTATALGQVKSEQPGFLPANFGGVPAAAPRPISLGGVAAQGGVPAQAPRATPASRPPTVAPMQIAPMPIAPFHTTPAIITSTPGPLSGGGFSSGRPTTVVIGNSGVFFDCGFHDDHFNVTFHVGSGLGFGGGHIFDHDHDHGHHEHHGHHGGGIVTTWPFLYSPWWYDGGYRPEPIYGTYIPSTPSDPNLVGMKPETTVEPTTVKMSGRDVAALYLSAGDAKEATALLRKWVREHADDSEALRLLGVALLENAQVQDGAASLAMAYHIDPSLAAKAIPAEVFMSSDKRLREDVRKATIYANRVNTSSGWLTVAVLMQAEGRDSAAKSMVEKAKAAGLEAPVADPLLAELGRK